MLGLSRSRNQPINQVEMRVYPNSSGVNLLRRQSGQLENTATPPPYSKVVPTAPNISYPNIDGVEVDRHPTYMSENYREERTAPDVCNPGPIGVGLDLKDFVCNHHVSRGAPGHCMGYFRPAL